eukprot:m.478600 g.478600  ORF g.478600 m.478600 type:complete len:915 (-) comp21172_c0_seq1:39-2783(-)
MKLPSAVTVLLVLVAAVAIPTGAWRRGGRRGQRAQQFYNHRWGNVARYHRQQLRYQERENGGLSVHGWAGGNLELTPTIVTTPGYKIMVQDGSGVHEVPTTSPRVFRGTVEGRPGAQVAALYHHGKLYARVEETVDESLMVEMIGVDNNGEEVTYSQDDVEIDDQHSACKARDARNFVRRSAEVIADRRRRAECGGSGQPLCEADLAIDADYEFYLDYQQNVANVESRVLNLINTVNMQYEAAGIVHRVSGIVVRTSSNQPFTSTSADTLLDQMLAEWQNNQQGIQHDVAHLFTGKTIAGSTIGIAYLNAVCSNFKYGVNQIDFNGEFDSATDLVAHELGHNWGANHCSGGCPDHTMNPSITSSNVFRSDTLAAIAAFRDSTSCLAPFSGSEVCNDGVDNDDNGDVDCDDAACASSSFCVEFECSDGSDNDQDGDTDCQDSDCSDKINCRDITVLPFATSSPLTIPVRGTVSTDIAVSIPAGTSVKSVEVRLDLQHSWTGDLTVTVRNNHNVQVNIVQRPGLESSNWGCDENNIVGLCTEVSSNVQSCVDGLAGSDGTFRPANSMVPLLNAAAATAVASDVNGDWQIIISDAVSPDGGVLNSATLEFIVEDSAPCSSHEECSGDLVCNAAGQCVVCLDDDTGCDAGTVCNSDNTQCVACEVDTDCAGADVCTAANECVTCVADSHCAGSEVCTSDNECVFCEVTSNNGCSTPEPYCEAETTCQECLVDGHCSGSSVCDTSGSANECVVCLVGSNAGCSSNQVCNGGTECVDCLTDDNCDSGAPVCDTTTNTCVQCLGDSNCLASEVCLLTSNECVDCEDDSGCENGQMCSADNTCVDCLSDTDCSNSLLCDLNLNECVECLDDNDCGSGFQCNDDNQCEEVATCLSRRQWCTANSQCCSGSCRKRRRWSWGRCR